MQHVCLGRAWARWLRVLSEGHASRMELEHTSLVEALRSECAGAVETAAAEHAARLEDSREEQEKAHESLVGSMRDEHAQELLSRRHCRLRQEEVVVYRMGLRRDAELLRRSVADWASWVREKQAWKLVLVQGIERLESLQLRAVVWAWREWTDQRLMSGRMVKRCGRKRTSIMCSWVLEWWREHVAVLVRHGQLVKLVLNGRTVERRQKAAFEAWGWSHLARLEERSRANAHATRAMAGRSFSGWRACADEQRRLRHVGRHVVLHLQLACAAQAWRRWLRSLLESRASFAEETFASRLKSLQVERDRASSACLVRATEVQLLHRKWLHALTQRARLRWHAEIFGRWQEGVAAQFTERLHTASSAPICRLRTVRRCGLQAAPVNTPANPNAVGADYLARMVVLTSALLPCFSLLSSVIFQEPAAEEVGWLLEGVIIEALATHIDEATERVFVRCNAGGLCTVHCALCTHSVPAQL